MRVAVVELLGSAQGRSVWTVVGATAATAAVHALTAPRC
jgi:hypothetical protein